MSIALTFKDWLNREVSNEQLMLRYAREQQRQLLDQLYRNCGADLYHFLLSLSSPELAEDIAQQAWIRVIEKRHLYQPTIKNHILAFNLGDNRRITQISLIF